ncbi:MAG TPA: site-2 protease family protein [Candidatus Omnitrophica bacterium]|nr:site-2 protease family protein [Candidatus Omnitrophota bacterium]
MGIVLSLAVFFSAVVIHEFAHAFVAYRRGDTTAQRMGRLTLNPLAHIDPFGTIFLPLMLIAMRSPVLFGWAKPVPINFASLKNPKKDMIWVGIAGPLANLLFAAAASILLKLGAKDFGIAGALLQYSIIVNSVLAVFNLIPIPPLDGSRVLMGLLPAPLAMQMARLEPYGFIILFALLYMGLFEKFVWPVAAVVIHFITTL